MVRKKLTNNYVTMRLKKIATKECIDNIDSLNEKISHHKIG